MVLLLLAGATSLLLPARAFATEPTIDVTAQARQTIHSSGVPHMDRGGSIRTTYDPSKSIFTNGIFWVSDESGDANALASLSNAGFNTAVTTRTRNGGNPANPNALSNVGFYTSQLSGGASDPLLLVDNRMVNSGWEFDPTTFNDARFQAYKSNPKVFGWWGADEVLNVTTVATPNCLIPGDSDCQNKRLVNFAHLSNLYSQYDPQTAQLLFSSEAAYNPNTNIDLWWPTFVDKSPVASVYYYPKFFLPDPEGLPATLNGTADQVKRMLDARGTLGGTSQKPAWFIPQAFWGDGYLYLSPAEAKAQAYTAIISGATGLVDFVWDSCAARWMDLGGSLHALAGIRPGLKADNNCFASTDWRRGQEKILSSGELAAGQALWNTLADQSTGGSLKGVNQQISELTPWLLSPTSPDSYQVFVDQKPNPGWSPLRTMLKYRDGVYYLLTVNVDNAPIEARIELPTSGVGDLRLPFGGSPKLVGKGKRIRDHFDPFGVHVYQFKRDSDGDGFSDPLEQYLGTDLSAACPASSGHDAYPPDLVGTGGTGTHDGKVLVNDILSEVSHYGSHVARYDLDGSGMSSPGGATVADILTVIAYFNKDCGSS